MAAVRSTSDKEVNEKLKELIQLTNLIRADVCNGYQYYEPIVSRVLRMPNLYTNSTYKILERKV